MVGKTDRFDNNNRFLLSMRSAYPVGSSGALPPIGAETPSAPASRTASEDESMSPNEPDSKADRDDGARRAWIHVLDLGVRRVTAPVRVTHRGHKTGFTTLP
jgi:hypothetical protein